MLQLLIGLWQHGQRRLVALPLLALLGIYLLAGNHDRLSIYNNLQSFSKAQEARGMVIVGRFGKPAWPAIVVDREDGSDGVQFLTPDGQSHIYQGFSGPMKALTLRSGTGPKSIFVVVLARRQAARDPLKFPSRR